MLVSARDVLLLVRGRGLVRLNSIGCTMFFLLPWRNHRNPEESSFARELD